MEKKENHRQRKKRRDQVGKGKIIRAQFPMREGKYVRIKVRAPPSQRSECAEAQINVCICDLSS